jgi:hypothetical protein
MSPGKVFYFTPLARDLRKRIDLFVGHGDISGGAAPFSFHETF